MFERPAVRIDVIVEFPAFHVSAVVRGHGSDLRVPGQWGATEL